MRNLKFLCCLSIVGSLLLAHPALAVYETPQQVFTKAVTNFNKSTSASFSGVFTVKSTTKSVTYKATKYSRAYVSPAYTTTIKSNFTGQIDDSEAQSKKYKLFIDLSVKADGFGFENLAMDLLGIGQKNYVRVNYAGEAGGLTSELNMLANQWILLDKDAINKELLGSKYTDVVDKNTKNANLDLKELQNTLSILRKNNVIVLTKSKDVKINGVDTYHYNYRINKIGLRKFLVDFGKHLQDKTTLSTSDLKSLDKWLKTGSLPTGGIWIGKKDYNIYRLTVVQNKNDSKTSSSVVVDIKFSDFNQSFYVDIPANFLTLQELFAKFGLSNSSVDTSTSTYRDSKRLSDLKQIQTAFELYYTDKNDYPQGINLLLGEAGSAQCLGETGFKPSGSCVRPYMGLIPKDPSDGGHYIYNYIANTSPAFSSYTVNAVLEGNVNGMTAGITLSPSGLSD